VRVYLLRLTRKWTSWAGTGSLVLGFVLEASDSPREFNVGPWVFNVWLVLALFMLLVSQYLVYADARTERDALATQLEPVLEISFDDLDPGSTRRWTGRGATEHRPITLLQISNTGNSAALGCRAQLYLDFADARFPSPADLPWWSDFERYEAGLRPTKQDLAPHGHGFVALADSSEPFGTIEVDEDWAFVTGAVIAWAEGAAGPVERRVRLQWEFEGAPIQVVFLNEI
jgi:hypothetical protein